jgi:hypothetical protein
MKGRGIGYRRAWRHSNKRGIAMTRILHSQIDFDIDLTLLCDFEAQLNIRQPERSRIPATILGYGEISTVFAVGKLPGYAFKRLSIFRNTDEVDRYLVVHDAYIRHLAGAGIEVVACGLAVVEADDGLPVVYIVQEQLEARSFAHNLLKEGIEHEQIFSTVLAALAGLWDFNAGHENVSIALDGQLSNWAIADGVLLYVDTSTPLLRLDGQEQLDPTLFLRPAPWFLRWLLRWFFMDDVVGRYYDMRAVVIDAIANLYKEQLPSLIPAFIAAANPYFPENPITEKEVRGYYREDAFIWSLYFNLRKFDRFLTNRILRGKYRYILPGKIER